MALPKRPKYGTQPETREAPHQAPVETDDFYEDDDLLVISEPSDLAESADYESILDPEDGASFEGGPIIAPLDAQEAEGSDVTGSTVDSPVPPTLAPEMPFQRPSRTNFNAKERLDKFAELPSEVDTSKLDPTMMVKRNPMIRTEPEKSTEVASAKRREIRKFGGIDPDFAVNGDYRLYQHLDGPIEEMVQHLQSLLSETGRSEDIGKARRNRNTEEFDKAYEEVDRLVTRALSNNKGTSIGVSPMDQRHFTAAVVNDIMGFGPLEPLWQNKAITEVMVNGPFETRVEIGGKTKIATGVRFRDQDHAMKVANSFLSLASRTMTTKVPYADSTLPDGSRLNATHPEISPDGPYLTIRRFPDTIFSMRKLVSLGSLDEEMAETLGNLVYHGVSMVVAGGTGTGKALAVDTPIPTPAGLIPLGELEVDDVVFGLDGKPTRVTGFYPQPEGRSCYRVAFSDGSEVTADAEHNWFVNGQVLTTQEIADAPEGIKHHIPLASAVTYPEADLPLDPYVLGFWLGCPNDQGSVCSDDPEVEIEMEKRGFTGKRSFRHSRGGSTATIEIDGLRSNLEDLGIDSDDPVLPEGYLLASVEQRRDLLAGLLDSGGILHPNTGTIEFIISGNKKQADQLTRLVTSLGIAMQRQQAEYHGNRIDVLVMETPDEVFRLQAKAKPHADVRHAVSRTKEIVSVERVESVDVACISVDNDEHLYLFGNEHTVTHNTSMLNALSGCIPDDQRIITVEDTLELQLNPRKQVLRLRSRPASPSGDDAVTIRDLVRNTLRQRPDRIVVGEVRDSSAYDMLQAMSTGHDGSMTTTHASSPAGTVERLALLISEAGEVSPERAVSLIASSVDILVNIERYPEDGSRRVASVSEVPTRLEDKDGRLTLETRLLWKWVRDGMDPETGKLNGHYEKVNDMSESLIGKHALDKRKHLSLEDLLEISDIEDPKETAAKLASDDSSGN